MPKSSATGAKEQARLWKRSFVDWSMSEVGFYVARRPDPTGRRRWINQPGPVVWQEHQIRVLRHLLTLNDQGQLPYTQIWWLDGAQTGKSTLQAAVAQWMAQFHGRGFEVQLAANSKEQAGVRVYRALRDSLRYNPLGSDLAEWSKEDIVFTHTGNMVRPLPLAAGTQAGGTPVFRGFDEIWSYEGTEAQRFFAEIKESPVPDLSLMMVTTYPGFEGARGPLNEFLDAHFDEYDHPRPHLQKVDGLDDLPLYVIGDVAIWWNHNLLLYPWYSEAYLARKRADKTVTPATYRRHYEVRRAPREDTFVPMEYWDACTDVDLEPLDPSKTGVPMVIGVDIGVKYDSSAAVARSYDPVTRKYVLLAHRTWNPRAAQTRARGQPDIVGQVKQWVMDLHRSHRVLGVYYDPYQFAAVASELKQAGVRMFEVTQNNMRVVADTDYRLRILMGELRNYPQCDDLRSHVEFAVARETGDGAIRLDKRRAAHHIDAAVADSMCCYGVTQHRDEFVRLERRSKLPLAEGVRWRDPFVSVFRLGGAKIK